MTSLPRPTLITGITPRGYLRGGVSHFRRYQEAFIARHGSGLTGRVVEIGGELHYNNARFFPNAIAFVCTNIARDFDVYLDVTTMPYPDESQDAYLCASVLNHVYNIQGAVSEMRRTLKPGGVLLIVMPFGCPVCDVVDHWRLTAMAYAELLEGFRVEEFTHLGGRFSTIVNSLQRPKGNLSMRHLPSKLIGLVLTLIARPLDRIDDFPLGFGIRATKV